MPMTLSVAGFGTFATIGERVRCQSVAFLQASSKSTSRAELTLLARLLLVTGRYIAQVRDTVDSSIFCSTFGGILMKRNVFQLTLGLAALAVALVGLQSQALAFGSHGSHGSCGSSGSCGSHGGLFHRHGSCGSCGGSSCESSCNSCESSSCSSCGSSSDSGCSSCGSSCDSGCGSCCGHHHRHRCCGCSSGCSSCGESSCSSCSSCSESKEGNAAPPAPEEKKHKKEKSA